MGSGNTWTHVSGAHLICLEGWDNHLPNFRVSKLVYPFLLITLFHSHLILHFPSQFDYQIQMQSLADDFLKILADYSISAESAEADTPINEEQAKKLKKKLKKQIVDPKEDDVNSAFQKFNKMIEGLNKSYESAFKAKSQYQINKDSKDTLTTELNKQLEHKKRLEGLHAGFMKKYNEELKNAQNYEVSETENKKKYTEELQARIKTIQDQFEESGKRKIESIRQNQMAKQELSRLSTHLQASEALVDAQLKKKSLEVDIQMSTLKQKVEMIETLKTHGQESSGKLEKARVDQEKIEKRLKVLEEKEEEHKLAITKAHLLIEDYKSAILKIREMLQKLTVESDRLYLKCRKSQQALKSSKDQEAKLKTERDVQNTQLQGLQNLQATLKEQLKNL